MSRSFDLFKSTHCLCKDTIHPLANHSCGTLECCPIPFFSRASGVPPTCCLHSFPPSPSFEYLSPPDWHWPPTRRHFTQTTAMLIGLNLWSVTQRVQRVHFLPILILFAEGPGHKVYFPSGIWGFSDPYNIMAERCLRKGFCFIPSWGKYPAPGAQVQRARVGLVNIIFNEHWCDTLLRSKCKGLLFVTASLYSTFWMGSTVMKWVGLSIFKTKILYISLKKPISLK